MLPGGVPPFPSFTPPLLLSLPLSPSSSPMPAQTAAAAAAAVAAVYLLHMASSSLAGELRLLSLFVAMPGSGKMTAPDAEHVLVFNSLFLLLLLFFLLPFFGCFG